MIQIIMLICGILVLVLPEDKLVNKDKLKPDQNAEQIVKQTRRSGIIIIVVSILMFFI